MKLTNENIRDLASYINTFIHDNFISGVTVIHRSAIVLSFAMHRSEKLFISLDHSFPFVSLFQFDSLPSTMPSSINEALRKEVKDGHINNVYQVEKERIIRIDLTKSNDYYERENKSLVIELIPHRPNLIILDKDEKILYAAHETDLSSSRPLMRGLCYSLPEKKNTEYFNNPEFSIDELKHYASKAVNEALLKRNKDKHSSLFTMMKVKEKRALKRIEILNEETEKLQGYNDYRDIGNILLTYKDDEELLLNYIKDIEYDASLTPIENANKYFKKYKKSRKAVEMNQIEIERSIHDAKEYAFLLKQAENMSEEEIQELEERIIPSPKNKKSKPKKPGIPFVYHNGVRISYGRSAQENDELTFRKAQKDDLFLHISKLHGSHLIIHGNKIEEETLLFAAELALLLSKEKLGDVDYALVKTIKKGPKPGAVLFANKKTIHLNKIREETIEEFAFMKR